MSCVHPKWGFACGSQLKLSKSQQYAAYTLDDRQGSEEYRIVIRNIEQGMSAAVGISVRPEASCSLLNWTRRGWPSAAINVAEGVALQVRT